MQVALALLCGLFWAGALAFASPNPQPQLQQLTSLGESRQWQETLEVFWDMCRLDPSAGLNAATWAAVMVACGRVAKWFEVMELLQEAVAKSVTPNSEMSAAAVNAYANRLAWEEAVLLLALAPEAQKILPKVVETCAVAGQSAEVTQLVRRQLETLDEPQGSALLLAMSRTGRFWRESMALLAKMRGQQLQQSAENLQDVMAACDPGSQWRRDAGEGILLEAVPRRPMEVLQLFCLARRWSIEPTARLYRTALGGLYHSSSGRFWAWALHLLEEMEAFGFDATCTDFLVAIEAVSAAEPEEAFGRTAEEVKAIKSLRAQLAKIKAPKGRHFKVPKFSPAFVSTKQSFKTDTEPTPGSPIVEDTLVSERMRTNEPLTGGPLRKWEMAVSLLHKLELKGLSADTTSFDHVVSACARAQELAPCKVLLDTMHCQSVNLSSRTFDSLIGGCSRKGLWQQALALFDRAKTMQLAGAGTYNQALKACARGKQPRLAMLLLVDMDEDESSLVSSESITSAMAACAKCTFWVQALQLLLKLKERQLRPSAKTYSAAVASCARNGGAEWEKAIYLLEESLQQQQSNGDVFAAAVIACQSRWELVLSVLVSMRAARIAPVGRTYSDVLRLFTAAGKATEVVKFLEEPLQEYDLGEVT